jgi:O-antigen ligase
MVRAILIDSKRKSPADAEAPLTGQPRPEGPHLAVIRILDRTAGAAFTGLILLALITPSWRYGPFAWLPITYFAELAGGPVKFGALNLLPLVLLGSWLAGRYLRSQWRPDTLVGWQWGPCRLTIPLLTLTLLGLLSLDLAIDRRTLIQGGGLTIFWLLYLYVINQRPRVLPILLLAGAVQGSVAVLQFLGQSDLGLVLLGELPLNPIHEGVSVLWARDVPWLRAYGLTAHPNLLGAILVIILLFALPVAARVGGRRQLLLALAMVPSLLGLLLTFSRSAVLGLIVGIVTWIMVGGLTGRGFSRRRRWLLVIPFLIIMVFLAASYGDLFISRVIHLSTPGEAQSLNQRIADGKLALDIIGRYPLMGVGLGNYTDAAQVIDPAAARVHNVPLLVTAELGIPGGLVLLLLGLSPLGFLLRRSAAHPKPAGASDVLALWVAMLVIGVFDTTLWLAGNWQTAILFALICSQIVVGSEGC